VKIGEQVKPLPSQPPQQQSDQRESVKDEKKIISEEPAKLDKPTNVETTGGKNEEHEKQLAAFIGDSSTGSSTKDQTTTAETTSTTDDIDDTRGSSSVIPSLIHSLINACFCRPERRLAIKMILMTARTRMLTLFERSCFSRKAV